MSTEHLITETIRRPNIIKYSAKEASERFSERDERKIERTEKAWKKPDECETVISLELDHEPIIANPHPRGGGTTDG